MGEASRKGTRPQRIAQSIFRKEEAARLRQEEIERQQSEAASVRNRYAVLDKEKTGRPW